MDGIVWRRSLVWTALVIYIAALAVALFGVWQADNRLWYIDGAGMDITLIAGFTDGGRWLATAVLSVLLLGGLAALVCDVLVSRRSERLMRLVGHVPPDAVAPAYASGTTEEMVRQATVTPGVQPVRYESAVVGESETRRMERSVGAAERAAVPPPALAGAGADSPPQTHDREDDVRAMLARMERQLNDLQRRVEAGELPPSTETEATQEARTLSAAQR